MQFDWDEEKRQEVIDKRGVDILYAALIFENQVLVRPDDREDYGEKRFIALGYVEGEFFNVVYTPKGKRTRLITAWKAGRNGEKRYKNSITG
jgi:uncharacterized DUF497 family protein